MKKEDILEKSRHENKNGDEREAQVSLMAGAISRVWMLVLCAVFSVVGLVMSIPLLTDTAIAYLCCSNFVYSVVRAVRLKNRSDITLTVISALGFICAVSAIVLHLIERVIGA